MKLLSVLSSSTRVLAIGLAALVGPLSERGLHGVDFYRDDPCSEEC